MKKYLFALICVFSLSHPALAEEKTITLAADEWCPYNCVPNSEKPGYMVEIAKAVFEPKGIKINYQVMPWERAIEDARKGTYDGIIGARVDDAPDFVMPSESLGYTTNTFYVKAGSKWQYEGLGSLESVSLGVIDGYSYEKELDKYISDNSGNSARIQSISGDAGLEQNFKKLEQGRIDVYLEDLNVAQKYIADHSLWGKLKVAGQEVTNVKEHYVYISFSPFIKESRYYAETLSEGIKELRASGKLKEILDKYNVQDWIDKK